MVMKLVYNSKNSLHYKQNRTKRGLKKIRKRLKRKLKNKKRKLQLEKHLEPK